ncbi:MAG: hypothetical protein RID23_15925 [Roseovarius sp.]
MTKPVGFDIPDEPLRSLYTQTRRTEAASGNAGLSGGAAAAALASALTGLPAERFMPWYPLTLRHHGKDQGPNSLSAACLLPWMRKHHTIFQEIKQPEVMLSVRVGLRRPGQFD